jgi:hypothetical protein
MIELQDWVWLIVAVVWLAVKVLPRLFKSRSGPVMTTEDRHQRHEQLDSAEFDGRGGSGPPPIEPR